MATLRRLEDWLRKPIDEVEVAGLRPRILADLLLEEANEHEFLHGDIGSKERAGF
jgi:hypothetical protein